MKNILIAIILLFTSQLYSQIPDSLDVDLPWQIVNLMSCDNTMGEGPQTNNEYISITLDSDSIIVDDFNECVLRKRKWYVLDWLSGGLYDFIQVGKASPVANTQCVNELILEAEELPLILSVEDLVIDMDPTHTYSLSYTDESFDHFVIDEYTEKSMDLFVYDWTDNTLCKTNLFISSCEDDIVLDFPETVEVEFNEEPIMELSLELLDVNIVYPCGTFTTKFRIGNSTVTVLSSQKVGTVVPVKVILEFSDGEKFEKIVNVNVTGVKTQPIPMYIEEVSFLAGEMIEVDIWSEEITGLLAWQLQLQFENTNIIGIEESDMFDYVPYNILDENTLRTLWSPSDAQAIDAESNATWYTLKLEPQIDGTTYDIFKTAYDPWSAIAIDDDLYIYEYEADFVFNVAARNVLNVEEANKVVQFHAYPNPSNDVVNLTGLPSADNTNIQIYDFSGKLVLEKTIMSSASMADIDISPLPSGLYMLKANNKLTNYTCKITKL